MTRVDFYVLPQDSLEQRALFACRLTEKAYRQGHQVYLHASDETTAGDLSTLLWGYRPQAFIPHGPLGSDDAGQVAIGWGEDPGECRDIMINLALTVPQFVGRFERVLEIVVQHPSVRDPLRESWKHYKHYGYPIEKRDL